jgi:VWFA-related protein
MKGSIFGFTVVLILAFSAHAFAQGKCFTEEEAKKIIGSINAPVKAPENKKVREELLKMLSARNELNLRIAENGEKNQKLINEANQMGENHLLRVCRLIKENGWLTNESVGEDVAAGVLSLLRSNRSPELQKEFFPVLAAATEKGLVAKGNLAWLIDSIRVGGGLPQIFGTQSQVKNELIYLYPILNEERLDKWRALYDLPPLAAFIKELEVRYRTAVIKSPRLPVPPVLKQQSKNDETSALGLEDDENEVVKVETQLVNLNVRVLNEDLSSARNLELKKEDFAVLEDGKEQEIAFFSTTDKPFDLILLLDLSGSTQEKQNLIIESAQRFVQAARPSDRVAIVTFTHEARIVANLTTDKKVLLEKVKRISAKGGSKVWDGLKFTYDNIIKTESAGRRSAIVFMTDGVDNSLLQDVQRWSMRNRPDPATGNVNSLNPMTAPSETTFTELLEIVRQNETTVFPIYLDTETPYLDWVEKAYRQARRTLEMLAEETGGQYYLAKNIKDLNGIYEKIIGDLSQVYSLGYESKNEARDGAWRSLTVKIKNQPKLTTRTKRGYYAK